MLASFRGGGLDTGCDDESGSGSGEDDRTADINSLLMQGAAINAQTDRTGIQNSFIIVMMSKLVINDTTSVCLNMTKGFVLKCVLKPST